MVVLVELRHMPTTHKLRPFVILLQISLEFAVDSRQLVDLPRGKSCISTSSSLPLSINLNSETQLEKKMSDNQWEPVIIRKKLPKGVSAKSDKVVNAARRQGLEVETVTKCKHFFHNMLILVAISNHLFYVYLHVRWSSHK